MTALSLRGLTVERGRRLVVEDVSFTAPAGQITAILGLRGAGKTSLLAAAAGLLPPLRGAVLLDGRDVTAATARRRGISFLAPGTALDVSGAHTERLGLPGLSSRRVRTLSHGEQLLALTSARLIPGGTALLVDEAGAGLDAADRGRLLDAMREAACAGRTIVMATRDEAMARAADLMVLLDAGRVVQAGTPATCYSEPRNATAALLTGPANILEGIVRERRPGGYVWTAAGQRFRQSTTPDNPPPPLAGQVLACLRPERTLLLRPGEQADNQLGGVIRDIAAAGPSLALTVETLCGPLQLLLPSWPRWPGIVLGAEATLGWSAEATTILDQSEAVPQHDRGSEGAAI